MSGAIYLWLMRSIVALYVVGGGVGLCAGRWRQGVVCLLLGVVNYLILF